MNSTTTNKQSIQPPPQVAEAPDDPAPPAGPGQRMKRERPDGPHSFAVRTRIVRATGSDDRYPCGAVRALPSPNRDTVVLQATDGKQAVCLLTTGRMAQPCLVPPGVLPTRQSGSDVIVRMVDEYWQSSEGKHAPDTYGPLTDQFPSVAEVLPIVGKRLFHETQRHAEQRRQTAGQGESMHIMLGVDVELLRKIAESLGNSKLTLFVPVPIKTGSSAKTDIFVNKPIAVCPATSEGQVRGIAAMMPIEPNCTGGFYESMRREIQHAETEATKKRTPKPKPVTTNNGRRRRTKSTDTPSRPSETSGGSGGGGRGV